VIRSIRLAFAVMLLAFLAACSKVPAGNVGVKFDMYGGDKGVTGEVVGPGKYWLGWNEEMYLFPTFSQTDTWANANGRDESIGFQDREGTQINADVGITFSVRADKADTVFQKYRKGINEISDLYLRNMVRDAMNAESSKMDVAEINGPSKEALMTSVTNRVRSQVADIGIDVEKIYLVSSLRLPPNITSAINKKIEATQAAQQRENELQTATAQAQIEREKARGEADAKVIAAEGEAKANRLVAQSISKDLIDYIEAQRWNGSRATVIGANTPIVDTRK